MLHSRWDDPAGHPAERPAADNREPLRPRLRWRPVAHHRQHHPVPVTSKRSLMDYAAGFPNNSSSCTRFWLLLSVFLLLRLSRVPMELSSGMVVVSTVDVDVVLVLLLPELVVTEVAAVVVVLGLMWEKWCWLLNGCRWGLLMAAIQLLAICCCLVGSYSILFYAFLQLVVFLTSLTGHFLLI